MELIARNSGRLRRLVDTLLDFARLEAARLVPAPAAVDLAALTRGIAESFAPAISRAGLGFGIDCEPLPEAVMVDVEMWEKIVLNLLSNAVKFTHIGQITLVLHATVDGGRVRGIRRRYGVRGRGWGRA
jgi:signal transduction histidine kinase